MKQTSELILEIYRAARETPVDEFQDLVLGLVRSIVPYDSSRWVMAESVRGALVSRAVHLQNEPVDIVLNWDAINHLDRFKDRLFAHPGRALAIHTPSFFAGPGLGEIRDYTQRYRHANTLGVVLPSSMSGCQEGLSLFRARSEQHFSDGERLQFECLAPHLVEALLHNRMFGLLQAGRLPQGTEQGATAIVRSDGLISYASAAFAPLLQRQWPDARAARLPAALLEALSRPGVAEYCGSEIVVSAARLGSALFLRVHPALGTGRLTPRELDVAQRYGTGHSSKEIARQLGLSPATVRGVLKRVFDKLQVRNKAELAGVLHRS